VSSEDVEVGLRIRFEGESKSIGARITQHAIFSTRFDVLAYTVDTIFAQLRSEFTSLHQGESQQRADAGKSYGFKIAQLERENAALLEILNRWNEICEMGLPDVVMPSLKPALFELWEATDAAIDAARAKEGGAL